MGVVEIMPPVLSDDADAWALLINSAYRRSFESTIETGRLLTEAKKKLAKHGTWLPMLETKLDFSPDTAQRLMAIARDGRLTNTAHVRYLPRSSSTLHLLTKLSDEQFARGIEEKIICPDMERKDVDRLRPRVATDAGAHPREGYDAGMADQAPQPGNLDPQKGEDRPARPDSLPPSSDAAMPGGGLAIAHSRIEPADSRDFFPTPPWATRALFKHVLPHLRRDGHCKLQTAWEPACGEGHMAEVMRDYFREVRATDIEDYRYGEAVIDFLHKDTRWFPDWIVTNPPFNDSADFVLKAIDLAGTGVAMFVRLAWLESVGRYERIFRDHPPSQLAIFSERVPLHKGRWLEDGATMTAYIWLVWIKGMEPQAPFWIPPGCRDALTQPDDAARFTQSPVQKREAAPAAEAAE